MATGIKIWHIVKCGAPKIIILPVRNLFFAGRKKSGAPKKNLVKPWRALSGIYHPFF